MGKNRNIETVAAPKDIKHGLGPLRNDVQRAVVLFVTICSYICLQLGLQKIMLMI